MCPRRGARPMRGRAGRCRTRTGARPSAGSTNGRAAPPIPTSLRRCPAAPARPGRRAPAPERLPTARHRPSPQAGRRRQLAGGVRPRRRRPRYCPRRPAVPPGRPVLPRRRRPPAPHAPPHRRRRPPPARRRLRAPCVLAGRAPRRPGAVRASPWRWRWRRSPCSLLDGDDGGPATVELGEVRPGSTPARRSARGAHRPARGRRGGRRRRRRPGADRRVGDDRPRGRRRGPLRHGASA